MQIRLTALWIAPILTYLLVDVLHIFSGDCKPGNIGRILFSQVKKLGFAALMVLPIVMIVMTLTL